MNRSILKAALFCGSVLAGSAATYTIWTAAISWQRQSPDWEGLWSLISVAGVFVGFMVGGAAYRWGERSFLESN